WQRACVRTPCGQRSGSLFLRVGKSGVGGDGDRRARSLLAQLQPVERRVAPTLAQQLVVTPRFDDRSILDDEDAIGIDDGMQAMCDHDRRSPLAEVLDRALDLPLGFGIERSRGL